MNSLTPLFYPNAIAVIGASRREDAVGRKILACLKSAGFPGAIFPINPKAETIEGLPCFASVESVPSPVDLAILAVPAEQVLSAVDHCHRAQVKAVIVISAGFAEVGEMGRTLQKQLLEKIRHYGMRMIGPNCFGVLNTDPKSPVNASFSSVFAMPGSIAMASQSGAMGLAILSAAKERKMGLSQFVSMGNKADVSSNDLVEHWEKDPRTKVILLYLESFGNPVRFLEIARRVSQKKPILAMKSGRSQSGSRAAGSHTAALAASDVAVDALFHQSGVRRMETIHEMFQVAMALDCQPLPKGNRVAILTNAGGPAILCADACEAASLQVPPLSEDTKVKLRTFLPPTASLTNPVDMIAVATPPAYQQATEILLNASEIDAVIVIHTVIDREVPEGLTDAITTAVAKARKETGNDKPIFFCLMKDSQSLTPLKTNAESIPVYPFPEEAAKALGHMASYAKWRNKIRAEIPKLQIDRSKLAPFLSEREAPSEWLGSSDVQGILRASLIPTISSTLASTPEAAIEAANRCGYPVALKINSRKITHKTEVGGVQLNLENESSVKEAFHRIQIGFERKFPGQKLEGVTVQPMAQKGIELFIGMVRDPLFGPLIGFGLGGIWVEVLSDIRFRLAPLCREDAHEMIHEIRGFRLLEGYRGMAGADITAIEALLLHVSELSTQAPEIQSLDLNPVIALPPGKGCIVVDARIQRYLSPK